MAILVSCSCGKRLQAPERLAGKQAKCPGCGKVLEVPEVDAEDSSGAYALAEDTDRECPECGRKAKAEARSCSYCGLDLHTGRKADEARACSICGAPSNGRRYCPDCAQGQVAIAAARSSKELRVECEICGELIYEDQACPTCEEGEETMDAALRRKKKQKAKGTSTSSSGAERVEGVLDRLRRRMEK